MAGTVSFGGDYAATGVTTTDAVAMCVAGNVLIDGNASVTGASTLSGSVPITGASSLAGTSSFGGGHAATGVTIIDAGS